MKTILVIDSSEAHRFLIGEELREEGYNVVTCNGHSLDFNDRRGLKPDFIVLDFRELIPKEAESLEALRNQYPHALWVGYSTFEQCPEESRKWLNFYLPKSSGMEELKKLIRSFRTASGNQHR